MFSSPPWHTTCQNAFSGKITVTFLLHPEMWSYQNVWTRAIAPNMGKHPHQASCQHPMASGCSHVNFAPEDQNWHAKSWLHSHVKHGGTWHESLKNFSSNKMLIFTDPCNATQKTTAVPVVCNPHAPWQKIRVHLVINRGVSYFPRHMICNTKGTLLISTKHRHHGCFASVLKCSVDITCATQCLFEIGE